MSDSDDSSLSDSSELSEQLNSDLHQAYQFCYSKETFNESQYKYS